MSYAVMLGLDERADVYVRDLETGLHTVLARSGLPVRLIVARIERSPADERAEPMAVTGLLWGPDYELPQRVQIAVRGRRYNVEPQTANEFRGPNGRPLYRRCALVEALV